MTEQNLELQTDSTIIDTDIDGIKSGGGKVAPEPVEKPEAPRKSESVRDSLEAEFKKASASKDEEGDDGDVETKEKPSEAKKEAPKPEKVEAKESAVKADSEQEVKTPKPSEGRKIIEAPARFLPRAKELWKNVPNEVREEWQRVDNERETEIARYRESQTFRDELKEYEDLASSKGIKFKDAVGSYVQIDKAFSQDPALGFRQLLQNTGLTPQQAIGHILRASNATPQQLMERMTAAPHEFVFAGAQQPQQVQQQPQQKAPDPEILAMRQELDQMRAERVANEVITPFRTEYNVDTQTWQSIEKVLLSGILEDIHGSGISPRDKLERALAMVAPDLLASKAKNLQDDSVQILDQDNAPARDVRGEKSVRSSIGSVTETVEPQKKMSMRDMLEEEARKLARRA